MPEIPGPHSETSERIKLRYSQAGNQNLGTLSTVISNLQCWVLGHTSPTNREEDEEGGRRIGSQPKPKQAMNDAALLLYFFIYHNLLVIFQ